MRDSIQGKPRAKFFNIEKHPDKKYVWVYLINLVMRIASIITNKNSTTISIIISLLYFMIIKANSILNIEYIFNIIVISKGYN